MYHTPRTCPRRRVVAFPPGLAPAPLESPEGTLQDTPMSEWRESSFWPVRVKKKKKKNKPRSRPTGRLVELRPLKEVKPSRGMWQSVFYLDKRQRRVSGV